MSEPNKIESKIVGYRVLKPDEPSTLVATPEQLALPFVPTKLERGDILTGSTYKVKQPLYWEHGFYLTINNTQVEGKLQPFEIFITSKNSECLPLLEVLSLTLTSMFRLQIDISFLLEEYRTIQDPKGGYRGKKVWLGEKPKYYTSLLGEFADIIEYHLRSIRDVAVTETVAATEQVQPEINTKSAGVCPSCQSTNTALMDNCLQCLDCGYSKCS